MTDDHGHDPDLDQDLDLDDERVRRLLQSLAGPPVDVEADLRAVHERAGRRRARRFVVPAVLGTAAAAAVASIVFVRVGSDDEVVPAGPGTDLPTVTTAYVATSPARPATTPTPTTMAPTTGAPATVPAGSVPATSAPPSPVAPAPTAAAQTKSFRCEGGSVTASWTASALRLQSVEPAAGYRVDDQQEAGDRIEVVFARTDDDGGGDDDNSGSGGGGAESELRLRLRDGDPTLECRD